MKKLFEELSNLITADNIALLSVIITVLIFVFSRQAELRYKKHDDKKIQYFKLIQLLEKMFTSSKENKEDVFSTDEFKSQFFDTGSSLLLYGSKKIYKQYLLFREITTNPCIKQCKYYDEKITMYIMSEILVTMRKEVGLNYFNNISDNEALGFFINDLSYNSIAKEHAMDYKFRIKMIKLELFMIDRSRFIWSKQLFVFFKPIFAGISILFKYIVLIPLGKLIIKLFPKVAKKLISNEKSK